MEPFGFNVMTAAAALAAAAAGTVCQRRWTQLDTDGTPAVSTRKSMYHPGGASVDWAGTPAVIVPPAWPAMSRSTRRWLLSNACVVTPLRTMLTHLIAPVWGDEIATVCPYVHSGATPAMTGRGPANRYGNQVQWGGQAPNEELALEVYSPPYLFAGPRPVIAGVAPEWTYGQTVAISSPQAGAIKWVSIVRNGVTTHAFDNCQRLVDLDITGQAGGTITARVPAQSTLAPPGWYMLFLVDTAGVPSVSSLVHLR